MHQTRRHLENLAHIPRTVQQHITSISTQYHHSSQNNTCWKIIHSQSCQV